MPADRNTRKPRIAMKILFTGVYVIVVLAAGFAILNAVAGYLLKKDSFFPRIMMRGFSPDGSNDVLDCYVDDEDNGDTRPLKNIRKNYVKMKVIAGKWPKTDKPIRCVVYPEEGYFIDLRFPAMKETRTKDLKIVFIGDSFTYGDGVSPGNAFPNLIEKAHNERAKEKWKVFNAGEPAANLPRIYNRLFLESLDLKPDIIVYTYILNDVPRYGALDIEESLMNNYIMYDAAARQSNAFPLGGFVMAAVDKRRLGTKAANWYHDLYDDKTNSRGIMELKQQLRTMRQEAERRGVHFAMVLFPLLEWDNGGYEFSGEHKMISNYLVREGIPFIDITESLRDDPAPALWVHASDHHPNIKAHKKASQIVLRFLEKEIAAGKPR